jgi:hypothetical protein
MSVKSEDFWHKVPMPCGLQLFNHTFKLEITLSTNIHAFSSSVLGDVQK